MIHKNKSELVTSRGIEGSPDLVVEILSPSSMKRDRLEKLAIYARYEIQEYWLIDPIQRFLEQYVLNKKRYDLQEIYLLDKTIKSAHIPCGSIFNGCYF